MSLARISDCGIDSATPDLGELLTMEEMIEASEITPNLRVNVCPVCDRLADELFNLSSVPENLAAIIKPNAATPNPDQVCSRCLELFTRALRQIESQSSIFEQNDSVLTTPLRMAAVERFSRRVGNIVFIVLR